MLKQNISTVKLNKIKSLLIRDYPVVTTPLLHSSAFELLVAVMLSAQTLDATVNKYTPEFLKKFNSPKKLADATFKEVDSLISKINYHKTKAKNLIKMANQMVENFDAKVPFTMEDLTQLPGVGRKTANVVINEWFARPLTRRGNPNLKKIKDCESQIVKPEGFVVDTHVLRVSRRLGLTKNSNPKKVEEVLMKIFKQDEWADMSLRLIFHGRFRCKAKNPECKFDSEWKKICGCCE